MNKTNIEWCDYTANPIRFRDKAGNVVWGCVKVSPGCHNCYAEALAHRYGRGGPFKQSVMDGLTPFLDEKELHSMLTYKPASGKRVFVGDMSDIFGAWVPDALLDRLFAVFALRDDVTWQVLTKRAERMRDYWRGWEYQCPRCSDYGQRCTHGGPRIAHRVARACGALQFTQGAAAEVFGAFRQLPLPNVWLGSSVEDQARADERIPLLLQTPAAVRFISYEPALGPLQLPWNCNPVCPGDPSACQVSSSGCLCSGLHWVIVGGESGHGARPFDLSWARSLIQQCREAGVPIFIKQMGAKPTAEQSAGLTPLRLQDKKGGEIMEWPADLRVREFPGGEPADEYERRHGIGD